MYALRPYLVNGYVPFGMQFAMKGASQPIDGLPWTMATKWDRLFVSVIKEMRCCGNILFCGVNTVGRMSAKPVRAHGARTRWIAHSGLNDAEKLIVSVTILNYFWAFGEWDCVWDGTLQALFMISDAKDLFHVYRSGRCCRCWIENCISARRIR